MEPQQRNIIIVVVAVLLLCCCCAALSIFGWLYGDQIMEMFGQAMPALTIL